MEIEKNKNRKSSGLTGIHIRRYQPIPWVCIQPIMVAKNTIMAGTV
jgi:hypothetical protein